MMEVFNDGSVHYETNFSSDKVFMNYVRLCKSSIGKVTMKQGIPTILSDFSVFRRKTAIIEELATLL